MNRFILAGCVSIVAAPSFAEEAETPTGLAAALIEAAAQTGDASQISAVANAARKYLRTTPMRSTLRRGEDRRPRPARNDRAEFRDCRT
ncbi:MAG: hypothetical protein R3C42_00600 [Parvularculaceae bacterium]